MISQQGNAVKQKKLEMLLDEKHSIIYNNKCILCVEV